MNSGGIHNSLWGAGDTAGTCSLVMSYSSLAARALANLSLAGSFFGIGSLKSKLEVSLLNYNFTVSSFCGFHALLPDTCFPEVGQLSTPE